MLDFQYFMSRGSAGSNGNYNGQNLFEFLKHFYGFGKKFRVNSLFTFEQLAIASHQDNQPPS